MEEGHSNFGGTLIWDGTQICDDQLEDILQSFLVHPRLSALVDMREGLDSPDCLIINNPRDSYFSIPVKVEDDLISKEEMLEIIHEGNYDKSIIYQILASRNKKGWSERQPRAPIWSLKEVENFEMAMHDSYKDFRKIQEIVKTRSIKEIIEFYYLWKQMPRYRKWKDNHISRKTSPLTRKLPSGKSLINYNTYQPNNVNRKSEEFDQQDILFGTCDPLLEFYYSKLDCHELEDVIPMNENNNYFSQDIIFMQ